MLLKYAYFVSDFDALARDVADTFAQTGMLRIK